MKDAYYFSHDSNAKDDPKVVLLIEQLGLEGYGIYWVLIETLRDQPEYHYPIILLPALARRYATTAEKMETVVRAYNLFEIENDEFFLSPSLCRRMEVLDTRRKRLSEAGRKGRAKQLQEPMGQGQAESRHPPGSKVNKSKVNKSKDSTPEHDSGEAPPSVTDDLLPESECIKVASFMADCILDRDPGYRHLVNGKREKTVKRWAIDIDKIHRIDGRAWDQVWGVTKWCLADDFWSKNILSGAKLREKFDQLVAQHAGKGKTSSVGNGFQAPDGFEKVLQ